MPDTLETEILAAPTGPLIMAAASDSATAFSIVVPTFNESENIAAFLCGLRDNLEPVLAGRYEIIVVDDDSPDRTWEIAAQALAGYSGLRVVRRRSERGLATGVMRGFQLARGQVMGTINADFQHPPDILPRMLELMAEADVVVASRYTAGG